MVLFRASAGERAWQVGGRFSRILVAFLLMMLTALAWAMFAPTRAYAADDQIDSFVINYDMQPSGVLKVKETITWRFGSNSGRHGIQRDLVTREPDPDSDQDFVYGISNIQVTSPDPNVATQFSSKTTESQGGREAELNVRIGDPDGTISTPTATYVISYDVTGAMRSFSGYDEFFWDGPGFGNPLIKDLKITTNGAWWRPGRHLLRGTATKHHTLRDQELHQGRRSHLRPDRCRTRVECQRRRQDHARSGCGQQAAHGAEWLQALAGGESGRFCTGRSVASHRDRLADRRRAVVAQERPRPALRRPPSGNCSARRSGKRRSCPTTPTSPSRSRSHLRRSRSRKQAC